MGFMENFRKGYEAQLMKDVKAKLVVTPGVDADTIRYTATGTRAKNILLRRGWSVESQDVSERGAWVSRWYMYKVVPLGSHKR